MYKILILMFVLAAAYGDCAEYINPLNVKIADPAIMKTSNGNYTYYMAGTGTERYVSDDLVNWRRAGSYINLSDYSDYLTSTGLWASELVEKDGRFYYYFCLPLNGKRVIYVADADSPDDTFSPLPFPQVGQTWQPVWSQNDPIIDPHVFVDDDGAAYLFYNKDTGQIRVIRLNDNMYQTTGSAVNLMSVSQIWENNWMEGVSVVKHNGIYYMTWSSNYWGGHKYAVGYATSIYPMGPYAKSSTNAILKQWLTYPEYINADDNRPNVSQIDPNNIGYSSPGHNGFVRSPDGTELFMCYHTKIGTAFEGQRQLCLDRVIFTPQAGLPDRMQIDQSGNKSPTRTPRPFPSGAANPYTALTDEFDGNTLNRDLWSNVWGEDDSLWSVSDGSLNITMSSGDMANESTSIKNVFLQKAPSDDFDITAKVTLSFSPNAGEVVQAYIVIWQDTNNYVMLRVWKCTKGGFWPENMAFLDHIREVKGVLSFQRPSIPVPPDTFYLRIQRSCGRYHQCMLSTDGQTWQPYGQNYLADLTDIHVGIGANKTGVVSPDYQAKYDWFDIQLKPDVNTDGAIDLQDFTMLAGEWLDQNCFPKPASDITNDCVVNTSDFEILASRWLTSYTCQE